VGILGVAVADGGGEGGAIKEKEEEKVELEEVRTSRHEE
jgi:hypothetical protein